MTSAHRAGFLTRKLPVHVFRFHDEASHALWRHHPSSLQPKSTHSGTTILKWRARREAAAATPLSLLKSQA